MKKETVLDGLRSGTIKVGDVPIDYRHDKDIIALERKTGKRKAGHRGFDAIEQKFFVEDDLYTSEYLKPQKVIELFDDFQAYYDALNGDIYADACYRYCDFDKYVSFIEENGISRKRLEKTSSFVNDTIDDMTCAPSEDELKEYKDSEKNRKQLEKWLQKFDACKTDAELKSMVGKYSNSVNSRAITSYDMLLWYAGQADDITKITEIISAIADDSDFWKIILRLCCIGNSDNVLFVYDLVSESHDIDNKADRQLRKYISELQDGTCRVIKKMDFNDMYNLFFDRYSILDTNGKEVDSFVRLFDSFEEAAESVNCDLSGVDLSKAYDLKIDLAKYKTDGETRLPITQAEPAKCEVAKAYNDGIFFVGKRWKDSEERIIQQRELKSRYFFDFVAFLRGDLTNAHLEFCDGIVNINEKELAAIDFTGAMLTSYVAEKVGMTYEPYRQDEKYVVKFKAPDDEEKKYSLIESDHIDSSEIIPDESKSVGDILSSLEIERDSRRIFYITDLHLEWKIKVAGCRSMIDVRNYLRQRAYSFAKDISTTTIKGSLLLIGGDTTPDLWQFEMFVGFLRVALRRKCRDSVTVVFVLGNHDIWHYPGKTMDEIADIYRGVLDKYGMYLMQNDMLYRDNRTGKMLRITADELLSEDTARLRNKTAASDIILFGGMGFAGYNDSFNADQYIYQDVFDRQQEIEETRTFERLYHKAAGVMHGRNAVVLTHMPIKDWDKKNDPYPGIVYVNGHTHREQLYDDGDYRIYADNQSGYYAKYPHLKNILIGCRYDVFDDMEDGIHEITPQQYRDFYRGINRSLTYNRKNGRLFVLKKKGYYCFIFMNGSGSLDILNGGAIKSLDETDIQYYYDHMDDEISLLRQPLDKYSDVQKQISDQVKRIGGWGRIHGCIIDIDFNNHLYLNPCDGKVTAYWAEDIVNKKVYSGGIGQLLKDRLPGLYTNYKSLIAEDEKYELSIMGGNDEIAVVPIEYKSTDIYKMSRILMKMQKLESNVLTIWRELEPEKRISVAKK